MANLTGLGNALHKRFPFAIGGRDYLLEEDYAGTRIVIWNADVLGPQPDDATLEQWITEAEDALGDRKAQLLLLLYQVRADIYQRKRGLFFSRQHDIAIVLKIVLFLFKQLVDDLKAAGVTVSHPLVVNLVEEMSEDSALQDRLFGQVRDLLETNDTLDARTTRVAKQILAAATPGELDTIEAGLRGVVQTGN